MVVSPQWWSLGRLGVGAILWVCWAVCSPSEHSCQWGQRDATSGIAHPLPEICEQPHIPMARAGPNKQKSNESHASFRMVPVQSDSILTSVCSTLHVPCDHLHSKPHNEDICHRVCICIK